MSLHPSHRQPRDSAGRYAETHPCDACGKTTAGGHFTDEQVCGATDGLKTERRELAELEGRS